MTVLQLLSARHRYGGNHYEWQVGDALGDALGDASLRRFNLFRPWGGAGTVSLWQALRALWRCDWLLTNLTGHLASWPLFWLPRCVIVHHVDWRGSARHSRWLQRLEVWALRHLASRRRTQIVTVSQVWARQMRRWGFQRVQVIYNAFRLDDYALGDDEVGPCLQRLGLAGQRLLYVGNGLQRKGAPQMAQALADWPGTLVATGVRSDLPATPGLRCLSLPFRDYLCVLRACEGAVLLSQFREGWNRTAHECVLVGTPVLGSGRGGMRELLRGAGQAVVTDAMAARQRVMAGDWPAVGAAQRDWAAGFGVERFRQAWRDCYKNRLTST